MAERFTDRVAVVTGASSGLGPCDRAQWLPRAPASRPHVISLLGPIGDGITFVTADISDEASVPALMDTAVIRHGRLDVVVANAGIANVGPWPDEPLDQWREILDINLNGTMLTCKAAWPHLVNSGGNIVVVSSFGLDGRRAARARPDGRLSAVCVRPGVEGRHRGARYAPRGTGGEHGVRVNVVRPGRILTDKWEDVLGRDGLFWSHYEKVQLLKRHGRTQDVAAAVAFLASDEAAFITAVTLDVDGGAVVKL